jgi:hypothetical protein
MRRRQGATQPRLAIGHASERRQVRHARDAVVLREVGARRLDEQPIVGQREPELEMPVRAAALLPLAADLQRVAVGLVDLLRLQVRPQVLERGQADRLKLIVAEPEPLPLLTGQEGLRPALHLNRRATELSHRQPVQDCRLACIVTAAEQRDAGMKLKRSIPELLEAVKYDARDHPVLR